MTNRELRLALAMRGGVSLAVWIGGACTEIDGVRRAPALSEADEAGSFWARLAVASGYDQVRVDVLAGASAGGLNGVIYAASQAYDFPMQRMRDLWVRLGDTDSLARRRGDVPGDPWPSLFKGDDYFFTQVESQLRALARDGALPEHPPPLDLRLSATLVEPIRRPGRSPADEPLTDLRFATGFAFVQPWHRWLPTDFPRLDVAGLATQQAWSSRLAVAARSTSSFPAAFEAAKVRAPRPPSFAGPVESADAARGSATVLTGVFGDSGATVDGDDVFVVSDGGIVDNIPLGRALDAIAQAPADRVTDRYLVYLQPGLPSPTTSWSSRPQAVRETAVSVLKGVLRTRLRAEDIIGDLHQLDAYNAGILRAESLRASTFGQLADADDLRRAATAAWGAYRALRADEDQRLVMQLLDDPIGTLQQDPFPAAVAGAPVTNARWRSPLDDTGPDAAHPRPVPDRSALSAALTETFRGRLSAELPQAGQGRDVFEAGALPLLRVIGLLIEWAQYQESVDCPGASDRKADLYRAASFVRAAVERPRRLAWVTLAATRSDWGEAAFVQASGPALAGLTRLPFDEVDRACRALAANTTDVLAATVQERLAAVEHVVRTGADVDESAGDLLDLRSAVAERVLVPIARRLCASRQDRAGEPPSVDGRADRHPGWYLDRVIPEAVGLDDLAALEVVCYPEFATARPSRRPVQFRRLSSANETPLAPRFHALLDAAEASGRWWDPQNTDRSTQQGLHVDLKLAGNELANFSAFLHPGWRLNDWLWGRLDAVPTLVELLVRPEPLRRFLTRQDDPMSAIDDLVLGPPTPQREQLRRFLRDEVWTTDARQAVALEVGQLLAADPGPAPAASLAQTRRALVAARQWEVLSEELLEAGYRDGSAAALGTFRDDLLNAVATHDTGAEVISSPNRRDAIRSRLGVIADSAAEMLLYNAQLHGTGRLGRPGRPTLAGRALRRAVRRAGRVVARRVTR